MDKTVVRFSVVVSNREGLRDAIVQASLELGSSMGEEGLTMRAIASKLGVSATALYQHFDSKASILREIRIYGFTRLAGALGQAEPNDDPIARLEDMAHRYVAFARENPWLYSILMERDILDWERLAPAEIEQVLSPMRGVKDVIDEAASKGRLREELSPDMVWVQLWASMHGVASLMLSGRISERHPAIPVADESAFMGSFLKSVLRSFTG